MRLRQQSRKWEVPKYEMFTSLLSKELICWDQLFASVAALLKQERQASARCLLPDGHGTIAGAQFHRPVKGQSPRRLRL
jgi:hypothetical protein